MKPALVATFIVTAGILLLMGILLTGRSVATSGAAEDEIGRSEIDFEESELPANFDYIKDCNKHVLKDFQSRDIFEKNKDKVIGGAIPMVVEAGRKLEKTLNQLAETNQLSSYVLILEGNLNNEWEARFDRNNTWAYQLSYNRALAVYKLWLKHGINIRQYPVETALSGGGYYGLCPQKSAESRRFSVQLIRRTAQQ